MKIVWLFTVSFVLTNAKRKHVTNGRPKNSRHVDLALETALIFDPNDAKFDISVIKTLRSYLDQLQYMIAKRSVDGTLRTTEKKIYTLKEFVKNLGKCLLEYKDENIKSLTVALQSVVEDYYPTGTVFHKIIFDPRLKAFIKNSIKEWSEKDPKEIKIGLENLFKHEALNNSFSNLLDTVSSFFDSQDSNTLKKLAKKFKKFPETTTKLNKLVEKTLNYVIFDKYETLNFTQKNALVEQLSKVTEYVTIMFKDKAIDPEVMFRYKRTFDNESVVNDVGGEVDKISKEFSESEREDFVIDPNDSLEKITRNSLEKDDRLLDNEINHEIVFDKNVEINVRHSKDSNVTANITTDAPTK